MGKRYRKINKKRVIFLSISIFIIAIFLFMTIFLVWAKTQTGYELFTSFLQNKPKDYWLNKVYYGIYKKYPVVETESLEESFSEETYPTASKNQEPTYQKIDLKNDIVITSDKDLYHSGEQIKVNLIIKSNHDINKTDLYIYGIPDKYDEYTIYEMKETNLKNGENNFNFSFELPYCNSCSGVKEGDYQIYAKIIQDDVLIGQSEIKISLKQ